jgi:hypothetical protein
MILYFKPSILFFIFLHLKQSKLDIIMKDSEMIERLIKSNMVNW